MPRYTVSFEIYNREGVVCNTKEITASALMDRLGIPYTGDFRANVSSDQVIKADTKITVEQIGVLYEYETETIPFETEYRDDDSLYVGEEEVGVEGYEGVKTYTYKCDLVNEEKVNRELVSEEVTTEPVNRVILQGTKVYVPPEPDPVDTVTEDYTVYYTHENIDNVDFDFAYCVVVRATCYSLGGTTATGIPTGSNVIAVDPNVIPLGTQCVVIGDNGNYGTRIAADVGGGIKGNIIDIWVPAGSGFGWQNARVYVLN